MAARLTIALDPDSLPLGATRPLSIQVFDPSGHPLGVDGISFASSDTYVLRVDGAGVVTAVGGGVAQVTARRDTANAQLMLRVYGDRIARVELDNRSVAVGLGGERIVWTVPVDTAGGIPGSFTAERTSDDPAIARFGASPYQLYSRIEGLAVGSTLVRFRVGSRVDSIRVSVVPPSTVHPVIEIHPFGFQPTAAEDLLFRAAADRWSRLLAGQPPPFPIDLAADACMSGTPALHETTASLIVLVGRISIGSGAAGMGAPCLTRPAGSPYPTVVGAILVDSSMLAAIPGNPIQGDGALNVVTHEIGHVLGIGTLWFPQVSGSGTPSPVFTGANARREFRNYRAGERYTGAIVPLETKGPFPSSNETHWSNDLAADLMVSWGTNFLYLTALTAGGLEDLGYPVDYAAVEDLGPTVLRMGTSGASMAKPGPKALRGAGAGKPMNLERLGWRGVGPLVP